MTRYGHTIRHDPEHPDNGALVKINSYLGIDKRGHLALSPLRKNVIERNTNKYGHRTGIGLLGSNIAGRGVDLSGGPPKD